MWGNHLGRVTVGLIMGCVAIGAVLSALFYGWAAVAQAPAASVATRTFAWTPPESVSPGFKTLLLTATDSNGATVTREVTVEVLAPIVLPSISPAPTSNDSGGGGDGGGGGGGGDGDESSSTEAPPVPRIAGASSRSFFARGASAITGSYSGVVKDGARWVGKLAHNQALLSQRMTSVRGTCTLKATIKSDKGPNPAQTVKFVTRINKKAWKVITLPKGHNDNRYRTYTIGLLRNFKPGTTLSFQLLNDAYDKAYLKRTGQLTEDRDLNLFIEKTTLECG